MANRQFPKSILNHISYDVLAGVQTTESELVRHFAVFNFIRIFAKSKARDDRFKPLLTVTQDYLTDSNIEWICVVKRKVKS